MVVAVGFFLPLCSLPIHCETKQKLPGPQGQDLTVLSGGQAARGLSEQPASMQSGPLPSPWTPASWDEHTDPAVLGRALGLPPSQILPFSKPSSTLPSVTAATLLFSLLLSLYPVHFYLSYKHICSPSNVLDMGAQGFLSINSFDFPNGLIEWILMLLLTWRWRN